MLILTYREIKVNTAVKFVQKPGAVGKISKNLVKAGQKHCTSS